MIEVAIQISLYLIIASFIGILMGYILGKSVNSSNNNNKKERKNNSKINPIFSKNSKLDNKPLVLSSPKSSGKDNLLKIKGIDEKIQNDLNQLGIYHFDQISKWNMKNCDWVEAFLLLPGCVKDNQWIEQAKILETGKETIYSQKIENSSKNNILNEN